MLSSGLLQFRSVSSPSIIPADIYLTVALQRKINYAAVDSKILHCPHCESGEKQHGTAPSALAALKRGARGRYTVCAVHNAQLISVWDR